MDRNPEERREETRRPSEANEGSPSQAANEVQTKPGNRRSPPVPPALETSEARGEAREEPFPHGRGQERPQNGLERTWWRRIFIGPHESQEQRRWWEFWR